ncbi:hypothetical protein M409DRAFT_29091 [Zasmidium cellare ATCC 36951]|uniref:RRM domain-containing protein n=1 Tax=Zasmidium cellare ATCC 36951 TaxID=1080233 RepID=A0A6A6C2Q5_ZASCE|nr:uncharacterized protein M409DRAFT_29091 [Zasmidium cellare ATCC 36951]KAF2160470.1 hypothetical protein M409DRAFT_29091 [Zasmidium cellare ATCC 36951]
MQSVRQIERLNQVELDKCVPPNASWHTDYRDTAYIYIGGLPFELSEGDVLTIFSQYGNPVHINLVRDKETGKSKGFCFLKYEDQRSCDLAVDNLSGAGVMGRVLSVDHTSYKKKEGEVEGIGDEQVEDAAGDDTDREGDERRKRRKTESESEEEERPMIKEEIELAKLSREHDYDDPMKEYLVKEKRTENVDTSTTIVLAEMAIVTGMEIAKKIAIVRGESVDQTTREGTSRIVRDEMTETRTAIDQDETVHELLVTLKMIESAGRIDLNRTNATQTMRDETDVIERRGQESVTIAPFQENHTGADSILGISTQKRLDPILNHPNKPIREQALINLSCRMVHQLLSEKPLQSLRKP